MHTVLKLTRRPVRHEDAAAEHYAGLRRAALHLARGDGAEADDVLHDTLVRFLLLRPDLGRIERLEGYLYTMLRHVYLSRLRRHGRRNALFTHGIDLDLFGGLGGGPHAGQGVPLDADVSRVVAHACERARSSRGASAWILRYVHGYYPAEIAQVLKMPPRAVDRALHVARREALEERSRPARRLLERLRGARPWRGLLMSVERSHDLAEPFDVVQALRARVFASVDGPCLSDEQLDGLYRPGCEEPAGTLAMAHAVACADCLDRINHRLGLSPLQLRDPVEVNLTRASRGGGRDDEDGPPGAGAAGGGSSSTPGRPRHTGGRETLFRRAHDTVASIVDHVPRSLRIVANGFDLGAQPVTGTLTEQELAVRLPEALAFVEVFDERGMLVCYWQAQLPNGAALDEHASIALGSDRRVDLQLSLAADCPRLRVCYTDERLGAAPPTRARTVFVADAGRLVREPDPWWRFMVPSRRAALALGAIATLWMVLVGPTSTWAALTQFGRALAQAIRHLTSSPPPRPEAARPAPPVATPAPVTPAAVGRRFGPSDLADLEMDARVTLHAMKADLGEDITLDGSPSGVVVRGVVATDARRAAIARAFAGRDGLRIDVQAAHRVASAGKPRPGRALERAAPSPSGRAVLESALVARLPDPSARAAFVHAALAQAGDSLSHAWALRRLSERYPPGEVARLGVRSSQALATLTEDHVAGLATAVDALTSSLAAFGDGAVVAGADEPAADGLPSILELHAEIGALHERTHRLLAGGGTGTDTALEEGATSLVTRLRRVASVVHRPGFASELRPTPDSASMRH